jgi:hypothetical protein
VVLADPSYNSTLEVHNREADSSSKVLVVAGSTSKHQKFFIELI